MSETIRLTVMRVRFHNQESGFTVAVGVRGDSGEQITFVGTCGELRRDLSLRPAQDERPRRPRRFAHSDGDGSWHGLSHHMEL